MDNNSLASKYAKQVRPNVSRTDSLTSGFEIAPEPQVSQPVKTSEVSALEQLKAEIADAPPVVNRSMRLDQEYADLLSSLAAQHGITPESIVQGLLEASKTDPKGMKQVIELAKGFWEQRQRIGDLRKAITRLENQLKRIR